MTKSLSRIIAIALLSLAPGVAHAFSQVRQVQISTNTLSQQSGSINISGATISTGTVSSATITTASISSATVRNLEISTITVVGVQGYVLLYSSSICIAAAGSTTSSAYNVAVATITYSARRITSRIMVSANIGLRTGDSAQSGITASLFRGSINLASAYGSANLNLCELRPVTPTSTTSYSPCFMRILDIPATTASNTWTAKIANTDNATSVSSGQLSQTNCITLEEWGY